MNLQEIKTLTKELMKEHGLSDWTFKFDNAKRRFGLCRCGQKLIQLSRPLTLLNSKKKIKDTILHEIAHALTYNKYGFRNENNELIKSHGKEWYTIARSIGCKGERYYDANKVKTPHKYEAICPHCREVFKAYKKITKNRICKDCYDGWNVEYWLEWKQVA